MRVIYKKTINELVHETKAKADALGKKIEKIIFTEDEARELQSHIYLGMERTLLPGQAFKYYGIHCEVEE